MELQDYIIMLIIFIGGTTVTVFSLYQYLDSIKKDKEADKLNNELKQSNKDNLELSKQLNDKANNIIESNQKVIAAQEETIKKIIGDGYLTYEADIRGGLVHTKVLNNSKYFLYDIAVTIYNYNEIINCKTREVGNSVHVDNACMTQNFERHQSFTLQGAGYYDFKTFKYDDLITQKYEMIVIRARNITVVQYNILGYDPESNKVLQLYKVYDYTNEEYNFIKQNYPAGSPAESAIEQLFQDNFHFLKYIYPEELE